MARSTAGLNNLFPKQIDSKTHFDIKGTAPDSAKLKIAPMSFLPSISQVRTAQAVKIHLHRPTVEKNRAPHST